MTPASLSTCRIALTMKFMDQHTSIWGAGIYQNVFLLYQLLEQLDQVSEVVLIDMYAAADCDETRNIYGRDYRVMGPNYLISVADVIIEVGIIVPPDWAIHATSRGAKLVSLRLGNSHIDEVMSIFGASVSPNHPRRGIYHEVWISPHHAKTSQTMLEAIYQVPVRIAPYIWDKQFCDTIEKIRPTQPAFGFRKGQKIEKIAICEPSISPVKTFHIPLLIAESLQMANPALMPPVMLIGGWHFVEKQNSGFSHFTSLLDLTKVGKLSAEQRVDIVQLLALHAQLIISHHWDNALNYLIFDALYGGYPVVHNSEPLKNYGYYYPDFDVNCGREQLIKAITSHSDSLDEYSENNQSLFWQYNLNNPHNQTGYDLLLRNLRTPTNTSSTIDSSLT